MRPSSSRLPDQRRRATARRSALGSLSLSLLALLVLTAKSSAAEEASPASPPATRRVAVVDTLLARELTDPYRWLEGMESPEVVEWSRAQDAYARRWIEAAPQSSALRSRLLEMADYRQIGDYVERGGRAFYLEGGGDRAQPILLVEDADGTRRTLVDPATLSPGSVQASWAVADYSVDPDGRLIAVALVDGPSRFFKWRFFEAASGRELPDRLEGAKIPVGTSSIRRPWGPDSKTFYYTRFTRVDAADPTATPRGLTLFRHELGSPQSADVAIYSRRDDEAVRFDGMVGDGGRYLVVHEWSGNPTGDALWVRDLQAEGAAFRPLVKGTGASFWVLGNEGSRFWLATDLEAPRRRVVEVDLERPDLPAWVERVPEAKDTLTQAFVFGGRLLLAYLHDARNAAEIRALDGELEHRLELPDGLIWNYTQRYWSGFTGDRGASIAHVRSLGPTSVGSIFRLDLEAGTLSLARRSGTPLAIDRLETEQIFFASADDERIPMFLVHDRALRPGRPHPTLLWVYGAFGWTAQPFVNAMIAVWLEQGGVLAMPNVRGGGAYGEAWREAGSRAEKLNTVRDTIAAAEWLTEHGWTDRSTLAVSGNSAGATAAGGALGLRPELFAAGIFEVPVTDLVRAEHFHGGPGWVDTFGTIENEAELKAILSYSPYQQIAPERCYPPVLIAAGDQDVTAVPMHAYKLTAALQHANRACGHPVLLRMDWGTDHGQNKPLTHLREERAAELAFLSAVLPFPATR
jgi:prolyl oligopeptidase